MGRAAGAPAPVPRRARRLLAPPPHPLPSPPTCQRVLHTNRTRQPASKTAIPFAPSGPVLSSVIELRPVLHIRTATQLLWLKPDCNPQRERTAVLGASRTRTVRFSQGFLQPIVGRETPVGVAGAGVGGGGAVAGEHLAGAPPGDAHQVGLVAARAEPLVGEGVPEHVWVEVRDTSLPGATVEQVA